MTPYAKRKRKNDDLFVDITPHKFFPEHFCPPDGVLKAYFDWAAPLSHLPSCFHLGSALALAACEASRRGYEIPPYGPPRIWAALVGPSGVGKSTSLNWLRRFAKDWLARTSIDDPFVSAEGSIPGVVDQLSQRYDDAVGRTPAILHHTEFSRVFRHKDEESHNAFNMLYDTTDYEKVLARYQNEEGQHQVWSNGVRKGMVRSPALSAIFISTQTALERAITATIIESGLFSRLFWFVGQIAPEDLKFLPDWDEEGYLRALRKWRDWTGALDALQLEGVSKQIRIDKDAKAYAKEVLFEPLRWLRVENSRRAAASARIQEHCFTVAALYALTEVSVEMVEGQGLTCVITPRHMEPAVKLAWWSLESTLELSSQLATTPTVMLSRKIYRAVKDHAPEGLPKSDLYRRFAASKRDLDPAIEDLLDQGVVVVEKIKKEGVRGRPLTLLMLPEDAARLPGNLN